MKADNRRTNKTTETNDVENSVADAPGAGQDTPTQQPVVPEGYDEATHTRRGTTQQAEDLSPAAVERVRQRILADTFRRATRGEQLPSDKPRPEYKRFAAALRDAMRSRGMTASDVARKVWGSTKDGRGYDVARNRDRLGHYLAGTSYPSPTNLEKLAAALDLSVEDLAPGPVVERASETNPGPRMRHPNLPLVISEVSDEPDIFRVQIDQHVDFDTAQQIMKLLQEAKKKIAAARLERSERLLGQIIPGGADDDGNGNGDGEQKTA